jgi:hypothetical protein
MLPASGCAGGHVVHLVAQQLPISSDLSSLAERVSISGHRPAAAAGLPIVRTGAPSREPHYWRGCRLCQRWRCGLGEALAEN